MMSTLVMNAPMEAMASVHPGREWWSDGVCIGSPGRYLRSILIKRAVQFDVKSIVRTTTGRPDGDGRRAAGDRVAAPDADPRAHLGPGAERRGACLALRRHL